MEHPRQLLPATTAEAAQHQLGGDQQPGGGNRAGQRLERTETLETADLCRALRIDEQAVGPVVERGDRLCQRAGSGFLIAAASLVGRFSGTPYISIR